jgi:hypothetical protein
MYLIKFLLHYLTTLDGGNSPDVLIVVLLTETSAGRLDWFCVNCSSLSPSITVKMNKDSKDKNNLRKSFQLSNNDNICDAAQQNVREKKKG